MPYGMYGVFLRKCFAISDMALNRGAAIVVAAIIIVNFSIIILPLASMASPVIPVDAADAAVAGPPG